MLVSLTTEKAQSQAQSLTHRFKCPHCNCEWFASVNDSRLAALENFVKSIIEMQDRSKEFGTDGVNLTITLQIVNESEGPRE